MRFNDYNEFFSFLEENQDLLTNYAYLRDFSSSVYAICSCGSKRQKRIAVAKDKYNMVSRMLGQDEDSRNDIKKILENQKIELYNDGQLLIKF